MLNYLAMSWSKVYKPFQKPLLWWYHKILCETFYFIGHLINNERIYIFSNRKYNYHLNKLCDKGFNLCGEKNLVNDHNRDT